MSVRSVIKKMKIQYFERPPTIEDFIYLYKSTGWDEIIEINKNSAKEAIENTWFWVTAFDEKKNVGVGRLLSDGSLYALVCDMIVLPQYQKHGIGKQILTHLKMKCLKENIQRVWLISTPGKTDFYEKSGFAVRPPDGPGMQLK